MVDSEVVGTGEVTGRLDRPLTEKRFEKIEAQLEAVTRSLEAIHRKIGEAEDRIRFRESEYTTVR
jgi:multidrug resistance efflux pump